MCISTGTIECLPIVGSHLVCFDQPFPERRRLPVEIGLLVEMGQEERCVFLTSLFYLKKNGAVTNSD